MDTFDFCPDRQVPETITPAAQTGMSMNGWQFAARPSVPLQRKFKVALYGLTWYLDSAGRFYDPFTNPKFNAHRLEQFYAEHQTWKKFLWEHPHIGVMTCRFAEKVDVPAGMPNSGGFIDKFEINFIEVDPGY